MESKALLHALLRQDDPDRALLGSGAFDLPGTLEGLQGYRIDDQGNGNQILTHPDASTGQITFEPGSSDNVVISGSRLPSRQPVVIAGKGNHVIIGPTKKFMARIAVTGDANLFFSGIGTTCNQANIVLQGHGRSIIFGKDCMLSFDVTIRAADSHAIIDLTTDSVINSPESILVGAHVWLGEGASVLKGARIGSGCVIALCALVTGAISEQYLAVGVPARVTRGNVSWTRRPDPSAGQVREVRRLLGLERDAQGYAELAKSRGSCFK